MQDCTHEIDLATRNATDFSGAGILALTRDLGVFRMAVVADDNEALFARTGRLDAEVVHEAALKGKVRLDPFLHRVLVEEWEQLGWSFQMFLAEQGQSSHMWLAARRDA
jgi:hypothetical protein